MVTGIGPALTDIFPGPVDSQQPVDSLLRFPEGGEWQFKFQNPSIFFFTGGGFPFSVPLDIDIHADGCHGIILYPGGIGNEVEIISSGVVRVQTQFHTVILMNATMPDTLVALEIARFAEESALIVVDNTTDAMTPFNLASKGSKVVVKKQNGEVVFEETPSRK